MNAPTQTQPAAKSVNLILPPGIGSFVTVLEPKPDDKGRMFYSVSIIYPKSRLAELEPLKTAVRQVAAQAYGPNAQALMQAGSLRNPLRDGDLRFAENPDLYKAYKGSVFIGARSQRKPQVIDAAKQQVYTDEDVYSGCLIRASISVFAYNKSGNKGVGLGLNNVQVLRKGERLDGRKSAEAEFTEWTDPDGTGAAGGGGDPLA